MQMRKTIFIITLMLLLSSVQYPANPQHATIEVSSALNILECDVVHPKLLTHEVTSPNRAFIENKGQIQIKDCFFYISGNQFNVAFGTSHVTFEYFPSMDMKVTYHMDLRDSNPVTPMGINPLDYESNYFIGDQPSRWVKNAQSFEGLLYRDVYELIDMRFIISGERLKYEFQVHPGGKVQDINIHYTGVEGLSIDQISGDLGLKTIAGSIIDEAPLAYQDSIEDSVAVEFLLLNAYTVGFGLGYYDPTRPLIIDPGIEFSTFVGGSEDDEGWSVCFDQESSIYIVGDTKSTNFPVSTGAYSTQHTENLDVVVLKLNATGTSIRYATYIGGSSIEYGLDIAVDNLGCAYVTGRTASSDFPTTDGAFDQTYTGGEDVFIVKLEPDGSALNYSTFIGGGNYDWVNDIELDTSDRAFITGYTWSEDFPLTSGSYDESHAGMTDCYLLALNRSGSKVDYSTLFGGHGYDRGNDLHIDEKGVVYLTGETTSPEYPTTPGAYDSTIHNDYDAFLTVLNPSNSTLLYSTLFGGEHRDMGWSIDVDKEGRAYITGYTWSEEFPTTNDSYDSTFNGGFDVFVVKHDPGSRSMNFSTFIGGSDYEEGRTIMVDDEGSIYVVGYTNSTDFPTTSGAFDSAHNGDFDVFFLKLDGNGSRMLNSSYLGGEMADIGWGMHLKRKDCMLITGFTLSNDFPITGGSYDTSHNGAADVFLVEIQLGMPSEPPTWTSIPRIHAIEDVPLDYDFSKNISDPDTPQDELKLFSNSSYIKLISGMTMTFEFPNNVTSADVAITVSDGGVHAEAIVHFVVTPVNDLPIINQIPQQNFIEDTIKGIDLAPYIMDEDTTMVALRVTCVHDYLVAIEGLNLIFNFSIWKELHEIGFTIIDGTEEVSGSFMANVSDVNGPPAIPIILLPEDGAKYEEGKVVSFQGVYDDPDLPEGQVLMIVWTSDIDGELERFPYSEVHNFSRTNLSVGGHTIVVKVSDGTYERTAQTSIQIVAKKKDSPVDMSIAPSALAIAALILVFYTRYCKRSQ